MTVQFFFYTQFIEEQMANQQFNIKFYIVAKLVREFHVVSSYFSLNVFLTQFMPWPLSVLSENIRWDRQSSGMKC